jgi:hypothetical protein
MSIRSTIFRLAAAALCGIGLAGASGAPAALAADCYGIARQVAAERGGQVHSAEQATRNGRPVCVIVVLVPAKGGQRGRRMEIVVPAD